MVSNVQFTSAKSFLFHQIRRNKRRRSKNYKTFFGAQRGARPKQTHNEVINIINTA